MVKGSKKKDISHIKLSGTCPIVKYRALTMIHRMFINSLQARVKVSDPDDLTDGEIYAIVKLIRRQMLKQIYLTSPGVDTML